MLLAVGACAGRVLPERGTCSEMLSFPQQLHCPGSISKFVSVCGGGREHSAQKGPPGTGSHLSRSPLFPNEGRHGWKPPQGSGPPSKPPGLSPAVPEGGSGAPLSSLCHPQASVDCLAWGFLVWQSGLVSAGSVGCLRVCAPTFTFKK